MKKMIALAGLCLTLAACANGPFDGNRCGKDGYTIGGAIAGGALGALTGAQFGAGSGNIAMTAIGTAAGAYAGATAGSSVDRGRCADQQQQ